MKLAEKYPNIPENGNMRLALKFSYTALKTFESPCSKVAAGKNFPILSEGVGRFLFLPQNGTWEEVETVSEEREDQEEMELSSTNVSVSHLDEKPEFCRLAPEKGPCVGRWTRYFYNESRDDCSLFLYGGCDGNENNFHSILACRVICQKPPEDPISRLIESPQHAEEKVKCIGHTKIEHP